MSRPHRAPEGNRRLRIASPLQPVTPVAPDPGATPEPSATLDDEALIDAVLLGDTRRARELHDRLMGAIEPALYRVLGRRESDHDDLVQASLEQVILTLRRGRFARGCSLRTWASAVAAHVAYNALRSRRSSRRVFEAVAVSDSEAEGEPVSTRVVRDAERDMSTRAAIRRAQALLAAMNPERAMVLVLHDVLGHELVEIAAMLGVSIAAAQSRLVRGRRELLDRLRADDASPERDREEHAD